MNIYTQTARFDTGRAMTEEEMRAAAPSIFAVDAHHSRSDRFAPIPTIEVLRGLAKEGFHPVGAKQAVARLDDRREYCKHVVRLRRLDNAAKYQVGDTVFEMLLKNANDGSSAYDLMAGLFRIRCLNSLVALKTEVDAIKVRHSGDVGQKVIEGTYRVLEQAERTLTAPQDWSRLALAREERLAFAEAARELRFEPGEGEEAPVRADQMLVPRRPEDRAGDLWTTFNVVQENSIRGGLRGMTFDANNRRRRVTTRPVKGIDQDVRLNRALWTLAAKMAEIKAAG